MESMFSSNRPGWAALLDEKVTAYLPDLKYVHDEPLARHTSFRIGGPATRMAFPTSGEQIVLLTGFAQECGVHAVPARQRHQSARCGRGAGYARHSDGRGAEPYRARRRHHHGGRGRIARAAGRFCLAAQPHGTGVRARHSRQSRRRRGDERGRLRRRAEGCAHRVSRRFSRTACGRCAGRSWRSATAVASSPTTPRPSSCAQSLRFTAGIRRPSRRAWRSFRPSAAQASRLRCRAPAAPSSAPREYFAGTLIEQCGLKGKHVGGAEVSRKHAGFVVNAGGATCADVLALIKKVQDTVFTATGVTLEPEVKIIR